MINQLLAACGLNRGEQTVLTFLFERGSRTAAMIAKGTGIKRPTVYSILENLVPLGLVTKEKRRSTTVFSTISIDLIPEVLKNNAKTRFEDVAHASVQLADGLARLEAKAKREFVDYRVETLDSTEAAYAQLFDAAIGGDFCAIFNPQIAVNPKSKSSVLEYLKQTGITKPTIREIAVEGPMTDWYMKNMRNKNHTVKVVPKSRVIYTNMIMRDGAVVMTHYSLKGVMTIKISHNDFFESMMTIFEMLWESVD